MKYVALWLFLFGLALRYVLIATFQVEGVYGQDAFAYLGCAREILAAGRGDVPCSSFFWPLGYPVLASLFMHVTASAARGAQLASVVVGAAIAPLVYWMVLEIGPLEQAREHGRRSALAAGLIAAACGMLMLSSVLVMSDAAGMFWSALAACLVLRWDGRARAGHRRAGWLVLAATALALAVVTRWIYAGLLLPFGVFVILAVRRQLAADGAGHLAARTAALRTTLAPLLLAAVVFLGLVIPQLYLSERAGAPALGHEWVVNWSPSNALRTAFDTPDGHHEYRVPPAIVYAAPVFHPLYVFPLLTACVFIGAWRIRRLPAMVLLGGWLACLYFYLVGIPFENLRFGLALFVPVAVLSGIGLFSLPVPARLHRAAAACRSLLEFAGTRADRIPDLGWPLLVVSLALALPFAYRAFSVFQAGRAEERAAVQFLQSHVPPNATVVTFELSISLEYYTTMTVVDLYLQSPQSLRPRVCVNGPVYLFVRPTILERQWSGRSPAENVRWLTERIGLEELDREGEWTLSRVARCAP